MTILSLKPQYYVLTIATLILPFTKKSRLKASVRGKRDINFSSWGQGQERFVIEESPAARTRVVDGPKKVNTIVIKTTAPKDIEQLLAHGVDYDLIFREKKAMPLKSPHQREIASYSMQRTISRSLTLSMMFLQLTRKLTLGG